MMERINVTLTKLHLNRKLTMAVFRQFICFADIKYAFKHSQYKTRTADWGLQTEV